MGRYIMELTLYHVFKVWFADVHRFHDVFWQARISVRPFWLVVDFDATIWSWKPKTSTRRVFVGQKFQTTAPARSENINLVSRELICAQVILKGRHSLRFVHEFASVFNDLLLGKPKSAARGVIWTARGNSIIIGANASARATAKPSTIKWFYQRRKWKIWPIKIRSLRYFGDNHYLIHTHHAWPSQMHSNLLISGIKTLAIARVLTLLINKFSCICEGQS